MISPIKLDHTILSGEPCHWYESNPEAIAETLNDRIDGSPVKQLVWSFPIFPELNVLTVIVTVFENRIPHAFNTLAR